MPAASAFRPYRSSIGTKYWPDLLFLPGSILFGQIPAVAQSPVSNATNSMSLRSRSHKGDPST